MKVSISTICFSFSVFCVAAMLKEILARRGKTIEILSRRVVGIVEKTIRTPATFRGFVDTFFSRFHKMCPTRSQMCRTELIQSALESSDPGASHDGSTIEIQELWTDLVTFEVARTPNN